MSDLLERPVLGLETSGRLTGTALLLGGRLAGELELDVRASSQELLLEMVRRLLACHSLRPQDLGRIGVALGPGSFTGLRVGLAAARALALGAGVPAVGIPSHQVLAWPWRDLEQPIVLLTGLRRGLVYLESGQWDGAQWVPELPAASLPLGAVEGLLQALPGAGRLLFVGEAVESSFETCPGLGRLGRRVLEPLSTLRRPAVVALLAARSKVEEWRGAELERLEPLYLRGADARRPGQTGRGTS